MLINNINNFYKLEEYLKIPVYDINIENYEIILQWLYGINNTLKIPKYVYYATLELINIILVVLQRSPKSSISEELNLDIGLNNTQAYFLVCHYLTSKMRYNYPKNIKYYLDSIQYENNYTEILFLDIEIEIFKNVKDLCIISVYDFIYLYEKVLNLNETMKINIYELFLLTIENFKYLPSTVSLSILYLHYENNNINILDELIEFYRSI